MSNFNTSDATVGVRLSTGAKRELYKQCTPVVLVLRYSIWETEDKIN